MSAPAPAVSPELKALLRRVKLGKVLDTLPERPPWRAPAGWATPSSWSSCWPTR